MGSDVPYIWWLLGIEALIKGGSGSSINHPLCIGWPNKKYYRHSELALPSGSLGVHQEGSNTNFTPCKREGGVGGYQISQAVLGAGPRW